jgi:hypothetical protein
LTDRTELGLEIEAGLREAVVHRKGKVALESRLGNPARTIEGWEQGRKIDAAHRVLLKVLAKSAVAVEAALLEAR